MNYLYKTIDDEIIVSEEEHQKILEAQKQGKNIIYLRGGKLMINLNFVGYVKETSEMTEEQRINLIENQTKYYLEDKKVRITDGFKKLSEWVKNQDWYQKYKKNEGRI